MRNFSIMVFLEVVEEMAHLLFLGLHVAQVFLARLDLQGDALADLQAVAGQGDVLGRVVGDQLQLLQPQVAQDLRPDAVVALVGLEAQLDVGLDGVQPRFLQLVGHDLAGQADAAPLLVEQVEEHAALFAADHLHRPLQLLAAVAAQRAEGVAGQALRMDAHQDRLLAAQVALGQGDVGLLLDLVDEGLDGEVAPARRQARLRDHLHQGVGVHPVLDDLLDGDDGHRVFFGETDQVGHARHGAVFLHDLADHPGRLQAGDARQIDRGLGLAGGPHHPPRPGAPRKDVPGPRQVVRLGERVDEALDGLGAVEGRNAGGGVFLGVDRYGERRLEMGGVVAHHQRQAELVAALFGERGADQAARLLGHEVDRLGSHLLGGDHQVALVLAVLVVDDDDHLALLEGFYGFRDGYGHLSGPVK
jgi:hypothetical protein